MSWNLYISYEKHDVMSYASALCSVPYASTVMNQVSALTSGVTEGSLLDWVFKRFFTKLKNMVKLFLCTNNFLWEAGYDLNYDDYNFIQLMQRNSPKEIL